MKREKKVVSISKVKAASLASLTFGRARTFKNKKKEVSKFNKKDLDNT